MPNLNNLGIRMAGIPEYDCDAQEFHVGESVHFCL